MIRFQLAVANKILVQVGVKVRPEYSRSVEENFQTSLMRTDFGEPTVAVGMVNAWVEEQTHGTIKNLLGPNMLDRNTKLMLVNTIYFKAEWRHQFASKMTEKSDFFAESGKRRKVQMMRHAKNPLLQICDLPQLKSRMLRLPYAGGKVVMDILLPNSRGGLAVVEEKLSTVDLQSTFKDFSKIKVVQVVMPKFKLEESIPMNQILKGMGMTDMFDVQKADFSGISDEQLWVSSVVQKAFVAVTEKGTEAGAATAVLLM